MTRLRATAAALAAVALTAGPAQAAPTGRAVERAVAPLGGKVSVLVADARSGKRVAAVRPGRRQSLG